MSPIAMVSRSEQNRDPIGVRVVRAAGCAQGPGRCFGPKGGVRVPGRLHVVEDRLEIQNGGGRELEADGP
ncbi:MAG: hypothetical protein AAGH64_04525, partial [Planctomycetota bacterium]